MSGSQLISVSRPAPYVYPSRFLAMAAGSPRFYWENIHEGIILAGIGITAEITAWGQRRYDAVRESARALFADRLTDDDAAGVPPPRLFGGFSFSHDFVTEHVWANFAPAYFILPHLQLTQQGTESWLSMHVQIANDEAPDLDALRAALDVHYQVLCAEIAIADAPAPAPTATRYPMSFDDWRAMIDGATRQMDAGTLDKVVLSRVAELRFDEPVAIDSAIARLRERYAGCYIFLFEPQPQLAFFGATPELLVQVRGQQLRTMALAASIRRGRDAAEDAVLAQRLMNDPKERYEHGVVVAGLRERLTPIADALTIPEAPGILTLANIQHLCTLVSAHLRDRCDVLTLVARLHPTPALGGTPAEEAIAFIQRHEPVPRGWYASPVGWITPDFDGTFAVAIRSAVAQRERAWLYSGAGVVAESTPQREWDETALKFRPLLYALGAEEALNVG